jgi:hypothetical protein
MFRYLFMILLFISTAANAMTSLRVGNKVLTIGDSAVKVLQLMGEPAIRTFMQVPSSSMPNNELLPAEQWQYAQDGKTIVITIVGGRATQFDTLYD